MSKLIQELEIRGMDGCFAERQSSHQGWLLNRENVQLAHLGSTSEAQILDTLEEVAARLSTRSTRPPDLREQPFNDTLAQSEIFQRGSQAMVEETAHHFNFDTMIRVSIDEGGSTNEQG